MNIHKIKLLLVLTCVFAGAITASAELRPAGSMAPDFTLQTLDGKTVTLSDLRGKPVVIEFWATWCGFCRKQFPSMVKAHKDYGDKVHFLMVNNRESPEAIAAFGTKVHVPGTILIDPEDRVGELYGTRVLPTIYFIDASGKIQGGNSGTLPDVGSLIKPLLKQD